MITETLEDFEKHVNVITQDMVNDLGEICPFLALVAINQDKQSVQPIIVPIPLEFLEDDVTKKLLMSFLPKFVAKQIPDSYQVIGSCLVIEAWIRKMDKKQPIPENWRDLPKTEGVLMAFETETHHKMCIFDIHRNGKKINEKGEIIDNIELSVNVQNSQTSYEPIERNSGVMVGFCQLCIQEQQQLKTTQV